MASPEITNYITQNLNLGYDINSIKNSLLQSGYTAQQVNAAIDYVSAQQHHQGNTTQKWSQTSSHSNNHAKPLLFLAGLLMLAVGIGLFVIFANIGEESTYERPYQPPEQGFEQPVEQTQTTQPVETFEDVQRPIIQTQTPSKNQQSSTRLSRLEIDETVSEIAATQPDKAIELCAQIITRAGTFTCVTKVAVESQDYSYCTSISDISAKDTCYMNFPINEIGNDDVCHKVANEYKKGSCFNLYETLDEIKEAEKLPVLSDEEMNEAIIAAQLSAPSAEEMEEAATGNAFGSIDDTIDDDPAI